MKTRKPGFLQSASESCPLCGGSARIDRLQLDGAHHPELNYEVACPDCGEFSLDGRLFWAIRSFERGRGVPDCPHPGARSGSMDRGRNERPRRVSRSH